jgi:hypothetical protein
MITEIWNVFFFSGFKTLGQNYTRKHQLFQLFYLVTYLYLEVYLKSAQYLQKNKAYKGALLLLWFFRRFNSESFMFCYVTFKGEGASVSGLPFISFRTEIKSIIFSFSALPIRSCFNVYVGLQILTN